MKIYTKTGDTGSTALIGGKRVKKDNIQIEAYGTIDELIAHIALLRDSYQEESLNKFLINIQGDLMVIAALLAADSEKSRNSLPGLKEDQLLDLEYAIDEMESQLPPLRAFVIPGGNKVVSLCHIVRTVCRRAERIVIAMSEEMYVEEFILKYINRLSDYFFVLSRFLSSKLKSEEIIWNP